MREGALRMALTSEARQRLANVKMVKPELASSIEEYVIQLASSGKLKKAVDDDQVKQMLQSRQLWGLQSQLTPEALRALDDVELHVQHDEAQEELVRQLTATVQQLEQRLTALELLLQDHGVEQTRVPIALQIPTLEVTPHKPPKARKTRSRAVTK